MNWSTGMACINSCMVNGRCDMETAKMISCHLHDYIEIACLYQYQVELHLEQGDRLTGHAMTVETGPDKHEYLLLKTHNRTSKVLLTDISKMKAVTHNPHFDEIEF